MKRILCRAAIAALAAAPALAQDLAPCGGDHAAWLATHAEAMTGTWIDRTEAGLLLGQPMPLGPPEPVDLTAIPGGFSGTAEDPVFTFELLLTDQPFPIDPPGGAAEYARLDRDVITSCAIADLPRLTTRYEIDIDGQRVVGQIAMVVVSTTEMHSWFDLQTDFGPVQQRSVLTR